MSAPTALPRRSGRPTYEDRETTTAVGRSAHWLESRCLDLAAWFGRFYRAHDRETLFDRDCDDRVTRAIAALDTGNGLEARALLLEYHERDALRDAEHARQRQQIEQGAHPVLRRIGAALERSCVALRGGR